MDLIDASVFKAMEEKQINVSLPIIKSAMVTIKKLSRFYLLVYDLLWLSKFSPHTTETSGLTKEACAISESESARGSCKSKDNADDENGSASKRYNSELDSLSIILHHMENLAFESSLLDSDLDKGTCGKNNCDIIISPTESQLNVRRLSSHSQKGEEQKVRI